MDYKVCHVEIPISDKEKGKIFYEGVFNWKIDFELLKNYGLVNNSDISIGFPIKDTIEPNNSAIYIQVEDINAHLENAKKLGARVLSEKSKISDQIGFGAKFTDIFGNQIGLFSST